MSTTAYTPSFKNDHQIKKNLLSYLFRISIENYIYEFIDALV